MEQKILNMLRLQDEMNRRIHPEWTAQNFEWYRAIWIECAELMDHHGWKWWKHQSPDDDQIKLELVDIWHFGLSMVIVDNGISAATATTVATQLRNPANRFPFTDAVETFSSVILSKRRFDISLFGSLIGLVNMDLDELYERYVGKNVLNFFRQDHGYKDGSYRKLWNGREDNEHLVDLVSRLDSSSEQFMDELYQGLEKRYAGLDTSPGKGKALTP